MWMDNPMVNVDADAIEGTVTDMYKMMVKLIRVFADIEAVQVRTAFNQSSYPYHHFFVECSHRREGTN